MSPQMGDMLVRDVVPRLRATASSVPALGHENREELVADMTANAAAMIDSAERAGKKFSAGNIAYYSQKDNFRQSKPSGAQQITKSARDGSGLGRYGCREMDGVEVIRRSSCRGLVANGWHVPDGAASRLREWIAPAVLGLLSLTAAPAAVVTVPPGEIAAITHDELGSISISIRDPFQGSAAVQRSTNFEEWSTLETVPLLAGEAIFTDPVPPPGTGFYRLAPPLLDYSGNATVSFDEWNLTIPEATPSVSLGVIRGGSLDEPLEVPWSLVPDGATPGEDYVVDSGVVSFGAGANRSTITIQLRDDAVPEPDEALLVVLSTTEALATPYPEVRLVLVDDEDVARTVASSAGLHEDFLGTDRGPRSLQMLGSEVIWNGPSERRLLSYSPGDWSPRAEAFSFGLPIAFDVVGPYLIRLEALSGITASCTGTGVVGNLVRSSLDGQNRLVLAKPALCGGFSPAPVASSEAVYYVESNVSPNKVSLRRVPINGGTPETLLEVFSSTLRSILVAGPYVWCVEDDYDEFGHSALWRVAVDGSGAEEWVTGMNFGRGRLVRDEHFLYLADTTFGGHERILRISPEDRTVVVQWEATDHSGKSVIHDLALASGRLFWLDQDSLHVLATAGGEVQTIVEDIEFPGTIAARPGRIAWSESDKTKLGRLRSYDIASGEVSLIVDSLRRPGAIAYSDHALWFTVGSGDFGEEGDAEIRSMGLEDDSSVPVAGGFTVQQPRFAVGGDSVYAVDARAIKRLGIDPQAPEVFHHASDFVNTLAADHQAVYWSEGPLGTLRALDHDGGQIRTLVASTGRMAELQARAGLLFWRGDPLGLRSVPVTGGDPVDVLTGSVGAFVVDDAWVFAVLSNSSQLVRVPHGGGAPANLASVEWYSRLAQTESLLIWSTNDAILSMPKTGGLPRFVVEDLPEAPAALVTDGAAVYWLELGADRLRSAPLAP